LNSVYCSDILSERLYEIDPFVCPKCGIEMKILAIIMDPYEINKILKHLVKTNKAPPGLDMRELN
jgi:hypothetical protein